MITILTIVVALLVISNLYRWDNGKKIRSLKWRLNDLESDSRFFKKELRLNRDQFHGKVGETISKVNENTRLLNGLAKYLGVKYEIVLSKKEGFVKVDEPKVEVKKGRGRPKKKSI